MSPVVALLDLDGTLVTTGGAGRAAMAATARALFGLEDAFEGFSFAGLTDFGILQHVFERAGRPYDDRGKKEFFDHYLPILEGEVARAPNYTVHKGALSLCQRLSEEPSVALGLGTGNAEPAARIKLAPAGLNAFFSFGGFGSESADREDLLLAGRQAGAAALGVEASACQVVVVGDTPRDVTAATAIGAKSIAVATGPFPASELGAAGATLVVPSLEAPEVFNLLRSFAR